MSAWQITTVADTRRKNHRVRTWTVAAPTLEDATYEARMLHLGSLGRTADVSVWITSVEEAA